MQLEAIDWTIYFLDANIDLPETLIFLCLRLFSSHELDQFSWPENTAIVIAMSSSVNCGTSDCIRTRSLGISSNPCLSILPLATDPARSVGIPVRAMRPSGLPKTSTSAGIVNAQITKEMLCEVIESALALVEDD